MSNVMDSTARVHDSPDGRTTVEDASKAGLARSDTSESHESPSGTQATVSPVENPKPATLTLAATPTTVTPSTPTTVFAPGAVSSLIPTRLAECALKRRGGNPAKV